MAPILMKVWTLSQVNTPTTINLPNWSAERSATLLRRPKKAMNTARINRFDLEAMTMRLNQLNDNDGYIFYFDGERIELHEYDSLGPMPARRFASSGEDSSCRMFGRSSRRSTAILI